MNINIWNLGLLKLKNSRIFTSKEIIFQVNIVKGCVLKIKFFCNDFLTFINIFIKLKNCKDGMCYMTMIYVKKYINNIL